METYSFSLKDWEIAIFCDADWRTVMLDLVPNRVNDEFKKIYILNSNRIEDVTTEGRR